MYKFKDFDLMSVRPNKNLNNLRYRDGEKLVPSDGVVIEEQRLTLKNATKKMSGQYVCSAANSEGDGFR